MSEAQLSFAKVLALACRGALIDESGVKALTAI